MVPTYKYNSGSSTWYCDYGTASDSWSSTTLVRSTPGVYKITYKNTDHVERPTETKEEMIKRLIFEHNKNMKETIKARGIKFKEEKQQPFIDVKVKIERRLMSIRRLHNL